MSEKNIEKEEFLEKQATNTETAGKDINEAEKTEETSVELPETSGENKISFIKSFSAAIIDKVIIGIISIIILYIFDALLQIGGYFIAQKISMLFIIFIVISIFYTSIMESTKSGSTIGKKLFNL